MSQLTVEEGSVAYVRAMRNPLPATAGGVCEVCRTFIAPQFQLCYPCLQQPNHFATVVPITYSEHLGQMHTALRNYKDGHPEVRAYAMPRIASIMWRFLASHEGCIARAAGGAEFDLVTTVPSSSPDADERRNGLRTLVGWIKPVAPRFERVLRATGLAEGRVYAENRYTATRRIDGAHVLLIDDTWAAGGHAQSAGFTLRQAGARSVSCMVIGRHLRPDWEVTPGVYSGELFKELPPFDWNICPVHAP